jgi:hypothetical protein
MTPTSLIKDLFLPIFLVCLIIVTLVAQHHMLPHDEMTECVDTLEYKRTYITDYMQYREVLRWCAMHENNWRQLVKLHKYSPKHNDLINN